ncbi:MAG TPA: bifunctional phosphopantothenoylcysteine decarboxylase/phosphopantothenate--cysteine ligase CoaBC [Methanosarcinaceae archaeon]|nr:bifunctional phosphopantothenoylcysteine decarboxylase/phosphopantothenate--cysteine ligase CoaBC [Methanosarcinaceae archaeon]
MIHHNSHPTLQIKGQVSKSLAGKTIVIGVTGSIAAVHVVELARELIRNGADVYAVTTPAAERIIHPDALGYATGNEVITKLTGKIEHVEFCGLNGHADLLLIAPATANTIGKIAQGIDDTPVTTFATTAIGSNIPVVIVPAMHGSMYDHPAVTGNIGKLKEWGLTFIDPRLEEGIAKIAPNDMIVLGVERALGKHDLAGKRIIITSGANAEPIDPIRILTNRSSGKTGVEIAIEAFRRGADVTIVHRNRLGIFGIREVFVETANDMTDAVLSELDMEYDALISAAAISDYTIDAASSKIKSGEGLVLKFKPTRKLIREARDKYPDLAIIGFKAETGVTPDELIKRACDSLSESKLDLVVANEVEISGMGTDGNEVYLVGKDVLKPLHVSGSKHLIASVLLDELHGIFGEK